MNKQIKEIVKNIKATVKEGKNIQELKDKAKYIMFELVEVMESLEIGEKEITSILLERIIYLKYKDGTMRGKNCKSLVETRDEIKTVFKKKMRDLSRIKCTGEIDSFSDFFNLAIRGRGISEIMFLLLEELRVVASYHKDVTRIQKEYPSTRYINC